MASNQNMTVEIISSMIVNAVLTRAIDVVILVGYSCLILLNCDRYVSSYQLGDKTIEQLINVLGDQTPM